MVLGTGWIILIVIVALVLLFIVSMEVGGASHIGGMKRLNKSKKNFGLVGLFLLLMSGLIFSNYIN